VPTWHGHGIIRHCRSQRDVLGTDLDHVAPAMPVPFFFLPAMPVTVPGADPPLAPSESPTQIDADKGLLRLLAATYQLSFHDSMAIHPTTLVPLQRPGYFEIMATWH
jgi:hypothetical protein